MATITKGKTFTNGELVTPASIHQLVDAATISGIVNADISASAAIADTKLAQISTANKVANSATSATSANTANAIVARDGSGNFSAGTITATLSGNATNVTGTVAVANGGTGATTAANARTNLGLGNSATLNTGTASGTVAAGDHTHSAASTTVAGFLSTTDKAKLDAATNSNTASTIVQRDASGNFNAGTITAALSGNATNVTGTVAVANGGTGATTAANARTNLGLGNSATLNTGTASGTVAAGDHTHSAASTTVAGFMSTTDKTKLDAATNSNTASTIVQRDASGNFSAGTITAALSGNAATATTAASCSGNAATATTLQTARTINGVSFNGSANITITADPNAHTHNDIYYTETEINTLLSDKQKINGQTISAGLNWNGNTGILFSSIPTGVQKFTLLLEIWRHGFTSQPGKGIVQIGTTTSGLITWDASGVMVNPYYSAVNNIVESGGFMITGGTNTSAEHVGVFNFYVTADPFNPNTRKRLICESHVTQRNTSTGAITILQGTGFIDYTGEINQFLLRPAYLSNNVSEAAARLYYYY